MLTPNRSTPAVRLYRWLALWLLPGRVTIADLDEMTEVFSDLLADCEGTGQRLLTISRCTFALPRVALLERLNPAPAPPVPREHTARAPLHFAATSRTTAKEPIMRRLTLDLLFAVRTLRRSPGFALSAVLLIALGVGAVTTIFTLFDNILLRPLPYPEEHRLVVIEDGSHSGPFWEALQDNEAADHWAAAYTNQFNLTGVGDPRSMNVGQVSEGFFTLFGARATEGRLLAPDDFLTGDRVLLSYELWQRVFGLDPGVLGTVVHLDDEPVEIVGVVERSFSPPEAISGAQVDFWRPMPWKDPVFQEPGYHVLQLGARLSEGATLADFQAEVQADVIRLDAQEDFDSFRDREGNLWEAPVAHLSDVTVRGVRAGLQLLLGAVGVLLLIACANVAHLSVARGLARGDEMTIRRALGAPTPVLVRQLLVESLVLSTVGGVLGVGLASIALRLFLALNPERLPRGAELSLDLRVAAFAIAVASLTGIAFGLLPAVQTVGRAASGLSQRSSSPDRRSSFLRSSLVVGEVALSLVLLVGAAVLMRSFFAVAQQDSGIQAENVWRMELHPPVTETAEEYIQAMNALLESLQAVPGVDKASYGLTTPFAVVGGSHCCWRSRFFRSGETEDPLFLSMQPIAEDYFATLGIPIQQGRPWSNGEGDGGGTIPAALPQSSASELFGSPDAALGKRLTGSLGELEIVAVVGDVRHYGLDQQLQTMIYLPMAHLPFPIDLADFVVRTAGPAPEGFERSLRSAVWSLTPDLPVELVAPIEQQISNSTAGRRFESLLFSLFGLTALALAGAGLYGTLLYNVGVRRREMGIRLALGAERLRIAGLVLRSGAVVVGLGILLGLGGAWGATRLLESRLWGVEARDMVALSTATASLFVVALMASWLPARKASRTDPVEALRAE